MISNEQILLEFLDKTYIIWCETKDLDTKKKLGDALDNVYREIIDWREPSNINEIDTESFLVV